MRGWRWALWIGLCAYDDIGLGLIWSQYEKELFGV